MPPYRLTQAVGASERVIAISMTGVRFYLARPVGPDDTHLEVTARLRIEDEVLIWLRSGWDFAGNHQSGPTAEFERGTHGTTAASHAAGAAYEWLGPPAES